MAEVTTTETQPLSSYNYEMPLSEGGTLSLQTTQVSGDYGGVEGARVFYSGKNVEGNSATVPLFFISAPLLHRGKRLSPEKILEDQERYGVGFRTSEGYNFPVEHVRTDRDFSEQVYSRTTSDPLTPQPLGTVIDTLEKLEWLSEGISGITLKDAIVTARNIQNRTQRDLIIGHLLMQTENIMGKLKKLGINHRDSQGLNFLVDQQMRVRIVDFGQAIETTEYDDFTEEYLSVAVGYDMAGLYTHLTKYLGPNIAEELMEIRKTFPKIGLTAKRVAYLGKKLFTHYIQQALHAHGISLNLAAAQNILIRALPQLYESAPTVQLPKILPKAS